MRLRQIVGQGKHAMEFILFTLVTFHFDSLGNRIIILIGTFRFNVSNFVLAPYFYTNLSKQLV